MSSRPYPNTNDRGSVLPLVIGMVACLLLLGAGVTAATSAFIAHNRLQHACDGAAASAADAATRAEELGGSAPEVRARAQAVSYLQVRRPDVTIQVSHTGAAVELLCSAKASIVFGGLFGFGTVAMDAHAVGRSVLGG